MEGNLPDPSPEDLNKLDRLLVRLVWRHVLAAVLVHNGSQPTAAYADVDEALEAIGYGDE
jgi:hypothetical protein